MQGLARLGIFWFHFFYVVGLTRVESMPTIVCLTNSRPFHLHHGLFITSTLFTKRSSRLMARPISGSTHRYRRLLWDMTGDEDIEGCVFRSATACSTQALAADYAEGGTHTVRPRSAAAHSHVSRLASHFSQTYLARKPP
jgi:hypothetical protein